MNPVVGALQVRVDENEADKISKVKKIGVTVAENAKRAALGELQNRGVLRAVSGKETAQKDLNNVKARVDSNWKKTTHAGAVSVAANNGAIAAARKVLTRSNSVRMGTQLTASSANNGIGLTRKGSSHLPAGANNKIIPVTTKMVENKLQHVKLISRSKVQPVEKAATAKVAPAVDPKLRREDSNLSQKSLTKLKAALSRDGSKPITSKKHVGAVAAVRKDAKEKASGKQATSAAAIATATAKAAPADSVDAMVKSELTHSSQLLSGVENIDAADTDNLVLVAEYVNDIYNYMFSLENVHSIRRNHLDSQDEVTPKMRAVLIDWINEVHLQFHLAPETFQMAVSIIDRYLQLVRDTKRSQLQLVGVTALFIAAKYEELFPPAIVDFVYITDNAYTAGQLMQMEVRIFKKLDCNLARPQPIHFLRRFSKAGKAEDPHHNMSKYFLELASVEYDMAAYKPSEVAAASLFLALHLLKDDASVPSGFNDKHWTPTLQFYSRYTSDHLRPLAQKIAAVASKAPTANLNSIYTKYQSSKFQKISMRTELYGALMKSIVNSGSPK